MVGAMCLIGRAARLGFLADLLSRPVLIGYLTGIALIMIAGQLENVTGVRADGSTFVTDLLSFARHLDQAHGPTLVLAGAVLAFLIAVGVLLPRVPGSLLAVFPVSSSGSRTVIGDVLGSRSQLASLVTLFVVIIVLVDGGPVLAAFPTAALGALVVYAALRLIDLGEFRCFARFRTSELALVAATTVAVLVVGVLYGVLVAVGLSIVDLLRRISRPHNGILGFVPGLAGMHDIDDYPNATTVPGLLVYRYDAPLCFANAEDFRHRVLAALDAEATPVRRLVLNMEAVIEIDVTAADTMHARYAELNRQGVVLAISRVKQELLEDLRRSRLRDLVHADRIYPIRPRWPRSGTRTRDARRGASPERTGRPTLCRQHRRAAPRLPTRSTRRAPEGRLPTAPPPVALQVAGRDIW